MSNYTAIEFSHKGNEYRIVQRLEPRAALHVARRVAPLINAMKARVAKDERATMDDMFAAVADALSKMPDEEVDYVVDRCLPLVQRRQGADWAPLRKGTVDMFHDMEVGELLTITFHVLKENLSDFFLAQADAAQAAAL